MGLPSLEATNTGGNTVIHLAMECLRLSSSPEEEAEALDELSYVIGAVPAAVLDQPTPNNSCPSSSTPLHMACYGADHAASRVAAARALLHRRAFIDCRTESGATPLMKAASTGSLPVVQLLLEARAAINLANGRGQTALDMANRSNRPVSRSAHQVIES